MGILVYISQDNTLRLWTVATQQQLLAVQNVNTFLSELIFSPNGAYLVIKTVGDKLGLSLFEAPETGV